MEMKTQPIIQMIKTCRTAEELNDLMNECRARAFEFLSEHPEYTYEFSVSEEEDSIHMVFVIRKKNQEELNDSFCEY